jgi:hypothetical protein
MSGRAGPTALAASCQWHKRGGWLGLIDNTPLAHNNEIGRRWGPPFLMRPLVKKVTNADMLSVQQQL